MKTFPAVGKIIVEKSLEEQIRLMCALSPDKEWSGVLFYTAEGSLEDKSVVIRAKDFYLMDLGTGGYTEFKLGEDPSIARFMVDRDLFDCKTGLIHSHNTMSAFFSGTDQNTLEKEGKDMPNFVSLVVNNAGKYVAAVTHKISTTFKGRAFSFYNLFGEEYKRDEERDFEKTVETVNIFSLDVEVENIENPLIERFKKLKEDKEEEVRKKLSSYSAASEKNSLTKSFPYTGYGRSAGGYCGSLYDDYDDPYSPSLFPSYQKEAEKKDEKIIVADDDLPYDFAELITDCCRNLLTANSKFRRKEAETVMKNSDYPIYSVVNTYNVKSNSKKFVDNINDAIADCRFACIGEKITWDYIKDFVAEELENLLEEEITISTNKTWYQKAKAAVTKIISIVNGS